MPPEVSDGSLAPGGSSGAASEGGSGQDRVSAVGGARSPSASASPMPLEEAIRVLQDGLLIVRPDPALELSEQGAHASRQLLTLCDDAVHVDRLRQAVRSLLITPSQQAFFAETGLHSAKGFMLELVGRIGQRLLPMPAQGGSLHEVVERVVAADDHRWIPLVSATAWSRVLEAVAPSIDDGVRGVTQRSLGEAARMLSYRLAGCALDRELLRADATLEEQESPFLSLNALIVPWLDRLRTTGEGLSAEECRSAEVLLVLCEAALERVRQRVPDIGVSIRLTYLIARMDQLVSRLRVVLGTIAQQPSPAAVYGLLGETIHGAHQRNKVGPYIGQAVGLLARNVTDHAARHGEHYIAQSRAGLLHMARAAAGGGVVIAFMALAKVQLALLHLPPLTAGIVYGLNYGLGFVLIHMLGFVVATKQPAMTAATIASALHDASAHQPDRLADLVRDMVRTQFVAVLGNVGLAFPLACLIAFLWVALFGTTVAPPEKLNAMLADVHPWESGALFFAAVAGVGLFLSGLVSGYFDNQARYHALGNRVGRSPRFAWLGAERACQLGSYLDAHYGAILGNLFFGMYLGLVGTVGVLTGLPIDIRHVAFSSANVGTALVSLGWNEVHTLLPWALVGVVGIAMVNLVVSFQLALYVAVKSRQMGFSQLWRLGGTLVLRFARKPLSFFRWP